jgi:nicotinate-nucleotide adenylyltransferase
MPEKYKTGIFGGSFDPVHKGHIGMAEFILDEKIVDKIIFLPSACPPHKKKTVASFAHRIEMLEIAVSSYSDMEVSQVEAELSQPSYTINSLRTLACKMVAVELFFILGADSLLELTNWYQYREILNLAHLVIVSRLGVSERDCLRELKGLSDDCTGNNDMSLWSREGDGLTLLYLRGFTMPFSSTDIRSQLGAGKVPQGLETEVFSYISQHGLYGVNRLSVRGR